MMYRLASASTTGGANLLTQQIKLWQHGLRVMNFRAAKVGKHGLVGQSTLILGFPLSSNILSQIMCVSLITCYVCFDAKL